MMGSEPPEAEPRYAWLISPPGSQIQDQAATSKRLRARMAVRLLAYRRQNRALPADNRSRALPLAKRHFATNFGAGRGNARAAAHSCIAPGR
jgi:hypothetical protein